MTGILIYNQDRPDIALHTGYLYGGLHCGECFLYFANNIWYSVRLEYDNGWILMHQGKEIPMRYGSMVQI